MSFAYKATFSGLVFRKFLTLELCSAYWCAQVHPASRIDGQFGIAGEKAYSFSHNKDRSKCTTPENLGH